MNNQWTIMTDDLNVSLNIADYTFIYTGISNSGKYLQRLITSYLQPRTKLKHEVRIFDQIDESDITYQHFFTVPFSGADIALEETLATKSNMKQQVKEKLLGQLEGQGYLLTINSLIEDYLRMVQDDFHLVHQPLSIDDILKQSSLNLLSEEIDFDDYYLKYTALLEKMVKHIQRKGSSSPILVLDHPENYFSSKQQLDLRDKIRKYADQIKIMVFSNSVHFSGETWQENNIISGNGEQILTMDFLDNLEWNAPLNYKIEELEQSLLLILRYFFEKFDIKPVISNYKTADINVFSELDIYVLIELLNRLRLDYDIDIDTFPYGEVISKYIQKHEKR